MKLFVSGVTIASSLLFGLGCMSAGGTTTKDVNLAVSMPHVSSTPDWVSQPSLEGGMVVTSCVEDNAPMSILKSKASALARADLAKELEQKTSALACNIVSQQVADGQVANVEDFQEKMRGLARQKLRGTRIQRADYAMVGGRQQFCTMVVVQRAQAERLRAALFDNSPVEISDVQEAEMWNEFLYSEASDELGGCSQ